MARFEKNVKSGPKKRSKNLKKSETRQADKLANFVLAEEKWEYLEDFFKARVVEVHKKYAFVSPEDGPLDIDTRDVYLATVSKRYLLHERKERNFLAVGDLVLCRHGGGNEPDVSVDLPSCVIEKRDLRKSSITRLDPLNPNREHNLAVNLTQLVIVASYIFPDVKWGLIDRYLALSELEEIPAVIILNKKDLLLTQSEKVQMEAAKFEKIYRDLGYPVLSISAKDITSPKDETSKLLAKIFKGHLTLLSGHSGVGKSTIVNALTPEIEQAVESEEIFRKGRHTTSFASLLKVKSGGFVIDSPGIKSFALEEKTAVELSYCFKEMRPFINQCKFRECRHIDEPQCKIREEVESGSISIERYKSYLSILTSDNGREGRLRDQR